MIKYILILLLISSQLFAIYTKAKQKGDIVNVKFLLVDKKEDFKHIKHITAYVGKRVVYDVSMNSYISTRPMFKFSYKFKNYGDEVHLVVTDNTAKVRNYDIKIKSSTYNKNIPQKEIKNRPIIDFHKTNPKVWKAKTIDAAIKEFYISNKTISGNIFLKTTFPIENFRHVPVGIKSEKELESVMILQEANEYSTVAIYSVPFDTKVDYKTFIKMKEPSNIIIIAKGINGELYKTDSISMLRNECTNNNYKSCQSLGLLVYEGKGVEQDEERAVKLLTKGCNGGSVYACGFIKYIFDYQGEESLNADIQMCNHGQAKACEEIGRHYLKHEKDSLTKRDKYYLKKDIPKAIWYFKEACIQDSISCSSVLLELANEELKKDKSVKLQSP